MSLLLALQAGTVLDGVAVETATVTETPLLTALAARGETGVVAEGLASAVAVSVVETVGLTEHVALTAASLGTDAAGVTDLVGMGVHLVGVDAMAVNELAQAAFTDTPVSASEDAAIQEAITALLVEVAAQETLGLTELVIEPIPPPPPVIQEEFATAVAATPRESVYAMAGVTAALWETYYEE